MRLIAAAPPRLRHPSVALNRLRPPRAELLQELCVHLRPRAIPHHRPHRTSRFPHAAHLHPTTPTPMQLLPLLPSTSPSTSIARTASRLSIHHHHPSSSRRQCRASKTASDAEPPCSASVQHTSKHDVRHLPHQDLLDHIAGGLPSAPSSPPPRPHQRHPSIPSPATNKIHLHGASIASSMLNRNTAVSPVRSSPASTVVTSPASYILADDAVHQLQSSTRHPVPILVRSWRR